MTGKYRLQKSTCGGRHANCRILLDGSPQGTLLEVGCGGTTFLHELEVEHPFLKCVGSDVDVETLRVTKREHPLLALVAASAEALPFRTGAFRTVIMLDVLEHVSDDQRAVREIARALKPGGRLVLTTPHRGLFSWLDVSNLKLHMPYLFQLFGRLTGAPSYSLQRYIQHAGSGLPGDTRPSILLKERRRELEHRHYSIKQLGTLLTEFKIERIRRTGLLLFPLMHIIAVSISKVFRRHVRLFLQIAAYEDRIGFGAMSYNIGVRAVKLPSVPS